MKPVNRPPADDYVRESVSGVDAVFERMLEVVGNPLGSYAMAFDVSENTIKTWRRRGAVSLRYLEGFAKEYGTTIDYLLYGRSGASSPQDSPLTTEERLLLEKFRASPQPLRDAAMRVLLGESSGRQVKQSVRGGVKGVLAGGDVHVSKGKRK